MSGSVVSRVGGKTQAPVLRDAAGTLRLDYAQFLELEVFTRFGGMPDGRVRAQLTRGARIREVLRQPQHTPLRLVDEVALMLAIRGGVAGPAARGRDHSVSRRACGGFGPGCTRGSGRDFRGHSA